MENPSNAKNLNKSPRNGRINWKRQQQRKRTLNLATWNVQGISNKKEEVFQELARMRVDICVLTETKKKGIGNEKVNVFTHFYSGVNRNERAKRGVSIAIHNTLVKNIKSWEEINERIIMMELALKGHEVVIVGVYAPTNDADSEIKVEFYETLTSVLSKISQRKEIVLMGDFNGRVGSMDNNPVIGRYGEECCNDNGKRLIELAEIFSLKVTNGFFQHKEIHRYTWVQATKKINTIIDYILLPQNSHLRVVDVRAYRGVECGSDHYMVKATVLFYYKGAIVAPNLEGKERVKPIKYNLESLQNDSVKFLYNLRMAHKLSGVVDGNAEDMYRQIKRCIAEAAHEALGITEKQQHIQNDWWNENLSQIVKEKKRLYQIWLRTGDSEDRKQYMRVNREVKREVAKNKNEMWDRKCSQINRYLGGTRVSEAWKAIKSLRKNSRNNYNIPLISIEQWKEYYEELLTENREEYKIEGSDRKLDPQQQNDIEQITVEELSEALKDMKNGKAPGPGNIPIELVKCGPNMLFEILTRTFNKCLIEGNAIPKEWNLAYLGSIYKKGSKKICANYRGISVTDSVGRLYGRIIKKRLESSFNDLEIQSGFRAGRSCLDNIYCLSQIIEKRLERNRSTHLVFVDLEKAYDSVPLHKLFSVLEKSGIHAKYINCIKDIYSHSQCIIKAGNCLSDPFRPTKGLKQGCSISPTLFKIYIKNALDLWNKKCGGMGIEVGEENLYTLLFADDQVVVANDRDDVEYMMRKLKDEYDKWGLTINMDKTHYMVVGEPGEDLEFGNDKIRLCNTYKYLGTLISKSGTCEEDIASKITNGRTAIQLLNPLLWSSQISKRTKITLFDTIVEPITTYGAEVWQMTQRTKQRLLAVEMDHWRRSCQISRLEHVPNTHIRNIMKSTTTIVDNIETRQLIWYGHVRRMPKERWPQKIWKYQPPYRRKRGRPRKTWMGGILASMDARGLEEEDWRDRGGWRSGCGKRQQL